MSITPGIGDVVSVGTLGWHKDTTSAGAITDPPSLSGGRSGSTTTIALIVAFPTDTDCTQVQVWKRLAGGEWALLDTATVDGQAVADTLAVNASARYLPVALNADDAGDFPGTVLDVDAVADDDQVSLLEDAALAVLENGEDVTYYPRTGSSRSIRAIIDRNPQAAVPGDVAPKAVIYVVNTDGSVTVAGTTIRGISSAEFDTGGDQIEYALRQGDAVLKRRVTVRSKEDRGMLVLEVR